MPRLKDETALSKSPAKIRHHMYKDPPPVVIPYHYGTPHVPNIIPRFCSHQYSLECSTCGSLSSIFQPCQSVLAINVQPNVTKVITELDSYKLTKAQVKKSSNAMSHIRPY